MMNRYYRILRVNLFAIAAGALALPGAWSPATAVADDTDAYRMAVIQNRAAGRHVVGGDFERAIDKIEKRPYPDDRFAARNNLCVAYTAVGRIDQATAVCDAALDVSRKRVQGDGLMRRERRRDQAIALSNRGVLRALAGDVDGARRDFAAAVESHGDLSEAAHNLARLDARVNGSASVL